MRKPITFSREFKLEAIRALDSGKKAATDLARELGIPRNRLYKWREQLKEYGEKGAFPGPGRQSGEMEAAMALLKRENERLREENEILKKAARYFAKEGT